MRIDRRTFLGLLAAAGTTRPGQAQPAAVPKWVPPGFPPFYEETDGPAKGLIVHKEVGSNDGKWEGWRNNAGDTAQREGFTWFAIAMLDASGVRPTVRPALPWESVVKLLEVGAAQGNPTGEFIRSPNPGYADNADSARWPDPKYLSRDQQTALVAALGGLGPNPALERFWNKFEGRGRACQNGDTGGVDHQNLFLRARQHSWPAPGAEPIESFGEFLLAGMVGSIYARGLGDRDDVGDDLNFCVYLAAARQWRPTKTSQAALREYVRTRPVNYGCYLERYRELEKRVTSAADKDAKKAMTDRIGGIMRESEPECHPIVGALRWYFRAETGAPWGPAAVWEQVFTRLFLPQSV